MNKFSVNLNWSARASLARDTTLEDVEESDVVHHGFIDIETFNPLSHDVESDYLFKWNIELMHT